MSDFYEQNLIFEVSANNSTGTKVQTVNEFFQSKEYDGFTIINSPDVSIAPKYIVPDKLLSIPFTSYYKHPVNTEGVTITIGFRTPSALDPGTTSAAFLFDFLSTAYCGYYFFRNDAKKIVIRNGTTNISNQTNFDFQPSTDYHIVYQFKNNKCFVYINGVFVVESLSVTVNSMYFSDTLRLFQTDRYGPPYQYCSRFYYLYVFGNTTTTTPNSDVLTPGFKTRPSYVYPIDNRVIPIKQVDSKIKTFNDKIFTYIINGQVTFNNTIKYKHPSTTVVQLLDVLNKTVLETTVTDTDGKFKISRDTIPSSSQILAIDVSGEYNTQILQMKL